MAFNDFGKVTLQLLKLRLSTLLLHNGDDVSQYLNSRTNRSRPAADVRGQLSGFPRLEFIDVTRKVFQGLSSQEHTIFDVLDGNFRYRAQRSARSRQGRCRNTVSKR